MSERRLQGTPIAPGVAVGCAHYLRKTEIEVVESQIEDPDAEVLRYREALESSRSDVTLWRERLSSEGAVEGAAILDCHLQMLSDPLLTTDVEESIRKTLKGAAYLFQEAVRSFERQFAQIPDPFFRERVSDLRDVARRVVHRLHTGKAQAQLELPEQAILFSEELSPCDIAELEGVAALVTRVGGVTSHMAIMAKARGIPYVAHIDADEEMEGKRVIVDGRAGEVIIAPAEATLAQYHALQERLAQHRKRLESVSGAIPETIEGHRIRVSANVEMVAEVDQIHRYGADGIGLFRSEYICLSEEVFPPEEEQLSIYRNLVQRAQGMSVVIRTFDVGGDKFRRLSDQRSDHPFLSARSLRYMLDEGEPLHQQLRAILRASSEGEVRILFPMVSGVAEVIEAKACIERAKAELRAEGEPFDNEIRIGCMIEIPSAALTADLLARECDFLSIGTNDLVQYALAVDRSSESAVDLYTPAHPAVIRLIKMIATEASRGEVPLTLCGEMASDPRFTALLIGLGINEFSVSPPYIAVLKDVIRKTSLVSAYRLAERALRLASPEEILRTITDDYQQNILDDSCAV